VTGKEKPVMATVANSKELQTMLKNPKFREAWNGFIEELDEGMALIKRGGQPTEEAIGMAAQRVMEATADLPEER
jgi:hypothetical protein